MQTLDVQNDMQPVNYTDAVQSSNQDKKNVKEPEVKGSSFIDIIKKLMAEEADGGLAGGEKISGNAVAQEAAEQAAHKKNAAAQTELSRLKNKAGKHGDTRAQHRAEAAAQKEEAAEASSGDGCRTGGSSVTVRRRSAAVKKAEKRQSGIRRSGRGFGFRYGRVVRKAKEKCR